MAETTARNRLGLELGPKLRPILGLARELRTRVKCGLGLVQGVRL